MLPIAIFMMVFVSLGFAQSEDTLQSVHVFFRHGSRTPEEKDVYPNDPYKIKDFSPMGWGQLTNGGKQRAYRLGKLLRKRYDNFLGGIYTPEIVQVNSTDYDRTKMSALLVLAGLFPPGISQQWDDNLHWMPIPYHFEKDNNDYYLRRPTRYCPTYIKELNQIYASPPYQRLLEDHRDTLAYIQENTGKPVNTLYDVFSVYQTLKAEVTMNLTLPEWTKTVFPGQIDYLAGRQCDFENYNDVLKRLNGGRALKAVVERLKAKVAGAPSPKMFLYSGHENNVINVLAALDVYEPHVPEYSAAVLVELHYVPSRDEHMVAVLYVDDVEAEPRAQKVPGCEETCEIGRFVSLVKNHLPENYTAECDSPIDLH